MTVQGIPADAKKVGDELTELRGDLKEITETEVVHSWVKDKYIVTNVSQVDISSPVSNNTYSHVIVPCTSGDKFTITGTGAVAAILWTFIDSLGNVLKQAERNAVADNLVITAPNNTNNLVVNVRNANVYSVCVGNSLIHRITELEKIEGINDSIKEALLACFQNIAFLDSGDSYENLRLALYGTVYRAATIEDIDSHVGYDNISMVNGTITAETVQTFSVLLYNKSHIKFTAPLDYVSNRFVFRKDGNNCYVFAGRNVFLFTKSGDKYTSADVTSQNVTEITYLNGWSGVMERGKDYKLQLDIENNILTLSDSTGDIMTVTNANAMGYWGANNDLGIGWKFTNVRIIDD